MGAAPTLPPPSDPAGWLNAWSSVVIAGASVATLIGAVIGAIWKLLIKPIRDDIKSAHGRLDELHKDLEAEKAQRFRMHIDNADLTGLVRREVVNLRAELIEKIADKADKDDITDLRDVLTERLDRLTEGLRGAR